MAQTNGPASPRAPDLRGSGRHPRPTAVPALSALDILPPAANIWGAITGFVVLMAEPWISVHALAEIWDVFVGDDPLASLFILANLEESFLHALGGAGLFLVIAAILQVWQHHRPFSSWWPIVLAFPIAFGLILPESLGRGGTWLSGSVVGAMIALAFGVQWGMVVYLRDTMD